MEWFTALLAKYPELGVYLALAIGYWVGTRKVRGFTLGGVTGSLLAGMLIGILFEVPVSATAKSVVFLLFLFGIGYEVGPRFVSAMKGDGWRFAVLGAFMPVIGLLVAWAVAVALDLNPGLAAGMLSGALTESPAMGTAAEAIRALPLDEATLRMYEAHIGVADALCYVTGALGVIFTCSVIGPALLRVDLKAEALKLEAQYGIVRVRTGIASAWQPFETRAYRVEAQAPIAGRTVAEAEQLHDGKRLFIHRIRRDGELMDPLPDFRIAAGDLLAIGGRREQLVAFIGERASEIDDRELLDVPTAAYEIYVSRGDWVGRPLEEVAEDDDARAVFLRRIMRRGQEIPIGTRTTLERGDVVQLTGPEQAVVRAIARLGEVVTPTDVTDFVAVGGAVFIGALLGAVVAVPVGDITVTIGTSVGALLAGIVTGHIRAHRPLFGRVPDSAVKFMQSFGLAAFVAMVGLGAGPHFIPAVKESGIGLLLGGAVVTMVPLMAGLWFGHKVLKINPILLLGAISGAQTFTAALAAVQEKSGSAIAVIGYSGSVAVAHVFLTTWGTVIVLLMV
ncbi:aspartate-alanine antiporter [Pseudoxanthomonas koreensis]|uniref:aspartate-alanine antiporter n=1 Tax=Pseudoxanthomonas koreensis TaxID=266061 RepID=UPI0013915631|nr:aspartate-alanine antiporter [Pseudoxanthomonas koreensis]KAF1694598.1 aspartate-alanine antiporter [Pseudoxanthomonas koreensis]